MGEAQDWRRTMDESKLLDFQKQGVARGVQLGGELEGFEVDRDHLQTEPSTQIYV